MGPLPYIACLLRAYCAGGSLRGILAVPLPVCYRAPLIGELALRILARLSSDASLLRLQIRTDAPAHRRLWLPSGDRETVHHATCSLRLAGTPPTMSERREEVKDICYTGKEPFDKFDRQVNRWARRRFKG